jgi:hypothetical protein
MTPASETITSGVKVASAIDHLKNNRIEYLLVLILSHFLGLTEMLLSHAHGVCA